MLWLKTFTLPPYPTLFRALEVTLLGLHWSLRKVACFKSLLDASFWVARRTHFPSCDDVMPTKSTDRSTYCRAQEISLPRCRSYMMDLTRLLGDWGFSWPPKAGGVYMRLKMFEEVVPFGILLKILKGDHQSYLLLLSVWLAGLPRFFPTWFWLFEGHFTWRAQALRTCRT